MSSSCKIKIEFVISGLCHVKSILRNIRIFYTSDKIMILAKKKKQFTYTE